MKIDITNGFRDIDVGTPVVVVGQKRFEEALKTGRTEFVVTDKEEWDIGIIPFYGDRVGLYIAESHNGRIATGAINGTAVARGGIPEVVNGSRFFIKDVKVLSTHAPAEIRKIPSRPVFVSQLDLT